jgi:hypothetical protein
MDELGPTHAGREPSGDLWAAKELGAKRAFDELPSADSFKGKWQRANARYRKLRKKVRAQEQGRL